MDADTKDTNDHDCLSGEVLKVRGGPASRAPGASAAGDWRTPGRTRSQKLSCSCGGERGAVGFDRSVVDHGSDLPGDRVGDHIGGCRGKVRASSGAVALEAVADVEVLLEAVAKREVEERSPVGGQLHRGGESALNDGEVAGGEVAVEVVDVGADLEPVGAREARGVDPRPGDDNHPQVRDRALGLRERLDDPAEEMAADAGATDGDDADLLVRVIAQLVAKLLAVGELRRVKSGHV